ncbi:MAG TPA: hypothetical protein VGU45_14095 [Microvirga sp.]|jgi:hypothetical protein|nr:hypothetical protein [Microvirga sp.]
MTVTSSGSSRPAASGTARPKPDLAAARTLLAGSASWGAATTVTLLGQAAKKGPATYDAKALMKEAGVNISDEQKRKLGDDERLTSQLAQMSKAAQADRKATAKQKIEQLKERLKQLMMQGGDPKQIARQAAQIARELKMACASTAPRAAMSEPLRRVAARLRRP